MWVVLKYKKNELNFLKHDLKKRLGDLPKIFRPKIKYQKIIKNKLEFLEKYVLEDYLICYHEKFKNLEVMSLLKNLRGLKYFLNNCNNNQRELLDFIDFCKKNENVDGYLKQSFFNIENKTKAKFISGPFTQMMFDIMEDNGKKLKVLINNLNITINKNSTNLLYG